ncbi:sigma-70 family RNA polymerase sigma factor [uncultured Microbacterium sp.]|uniref:RNA polymerase sigma factor n=1 Tax=uncultured Microbacterium sp. TaxID=191216 RepID=UPI0028D8BA35|nr:sigma-70 family RNA polymerase sigma factor [uncultured Microbacterium sp.]
MSTRGDDAEKKKDAAFSAVFDANWARVRHHVEGVVDDDAEVTEIVSEVFLMAWARLDPARPVDRLWLLRTADRVLRSRPARSVMRRTALDAVHQGMSGVQGRTDLTMRVRVLTALGVLSRTERRIIMLTYWDGLAVGEIAEMLRSPKIRVRKSLRRAQRKLRAALGLEEAG